MSSHFIDLPFTPQEKDGTRSSTRENKVTRRLRLGMVGGGQGAFIGAVHRIAARLDDHYELVAAVLSSDPVKSMTDAADLNIARSYPNYKEMAANESVRDDGIDVVAIVTPNHLHHPIAKCFLEAGIHVICEKPMTTSVEDAIDLVRVVDATGKVFRLTHTYSGYSMVRQARQMINAGDIGKIRLVQVEYTQDWLTLPLETSGAKQADWRTDPERGGPAGCLGDIGTHAYHLVCYTTGLICEEVLADVSSFVPGRRVDDNVHVLMRFSDGAKGSLWASQVAPGNENNLNLRVFGDKGGISWSQENPNHIVFTLLGESPRIISRGSPMLGAAARRATRIPSGHPEGYFEAFAQLYTDIAEELRARIEGCAPHPNALTVPGVKDGLAGLYFVDGVLASGRNGSMWTPIKSCDSLLVSGS